MTQMSLRQSFLNPTTTLRRLTLSCDDAQLARDWQETLHAEGLEVTRLGEPDAACDAHLLIVSQGGVAAQLPRLRQQREALPHAPLLVVDRKSVV